MTHYCPEPTCGDLCSEHERRRHSLAVFASHKAATVPIAQKAATYQRLLAEPAAKIRSQIAAAVNQQQEQLHIAVAEVKQIELQLAQKKQQAQAKAEAFAALKLTADRMANADDSTLLDIEAERLEAAGQVRISAHGPLIDSAILNTLDESLVEALQSWRCPTTVEGEAGIARRKMGLCRATGGVSVKVNSTF